MSGKRSPAYPFIDLEAAIERARKLYVVEKGNPIPIETAAVDWKLKTTTSVFMQSIAALKYYGLLENRGVGKQRKIILAAAGLLKAVQEAPRKWGTALRLDCVMLHRSDDGGHVRLGSKVVRLRASICCPPYPR